MTPIIFDGASYVAWGKPTHRAAPGAALILALVGMRRADTVRLERTAFGYRVPAEAAPKKKRRKPKGGGASTSRPSLGPQRPSLGRGRPPTKSL
jgi:hypothetical protein